MSERLVPIGCKIPQEMFDEIQKIVIEYGISQSELLRSALEDFIAPFRENKRPVVNPKLTEATLQAHMLACPVWRSLKQTGKLKVNGH